MMSERSNAKHAKEASHVKIWPEFASSAMIRVLRVLSSLRQHVAGRPLELQLPQVVQALRNLFNRGRRFVLDEIPFDAGLMGGLHNGGPIHDPGAERDIVADI